MANVGTAFVKFMPNFSGFAAATRTQMNSLSSQLAHSGNSVNIGFLLPVAAGLTKIITTAASFEHQMRELESVISGGDFNFFEPGEMEDIERRIRQIGVNSIFTTEQLGDAAVFIARTGVKSADQLEGVLSTSNQLAIATNAPLERVADALTNIAKVRGTIDNFGNINTQELNDTAEIIAAVTSRANVDFAQFWEGFKRGGPVAEAVGRNFEEVAGAIGFLGDRGIQGSRASTAIQNLMTRLVNVTPATTAALREFGLTVDDVSLETNTLEESFRNFQEAGVDLETTFKVLGLRAAPGFAKLFQDPDALNGLINSIDDLDPDKLAESGFSLQGMVDINQASFINQLKLLKSSFQELALVIDDLGLNSFILGFVQDLTKAVDSLAKAIENNPVAFERMGKAILGLAAIGPINFMVSRAAISFRIFLGTLKLFVKRLPIYGAMVFLIDLIRKVLFESEEVAESFRFFWEEVKNLSSAISELLPGFSILSDETDKLADFLSGGLAKGLDEVARALQWVTAQVELIIAPFVHFREHIEASEPSMAAFRGLLDLVIENLGTAESRFQTFLPFLERLAGALEAVNADEFKDIFTVEFAEAFAPEITQKVRDMVEAVQDIIQKIKDFKTEVQGLAELQLENIVGSVNETLFGQSGTGLPHGGGPPPTEGIISEGQSLVDRIKEAFSEGFEDASTGTEIITDREPLELLIETVKTIGSVASSLATILATITPGLLVLFDRIQRMASALNEMFVALRNNSVAWGILTTTILIFSDIASAPFRIIQGLAEIITGLLELDFGKFMGGLGNVLKGILDLAVIGKLFKGVSKVIGKLVGKIPGVGKAFTTVGGIFSKVFGTLVSKLTTLQRIFLTVASVITSAWGFAWGAIGAVFDNIDEWGSAWDLFVTGLEAAFGPVVEGLKTLWNTFWQPLKLAWKLGEIAWGNLTSFMERKWGEFTDALGTRWDAVWGGIKDAFNDFIETIKNLPGDARAAWGELVEIILGAVDDIVNAPGVSQLLDIIGAISGFSLGDLNPFGGDDNPGLSLDDFQNFQEFGTFPGDSAFSKGAIVNGPTRALIGEAGAEAVLPLTNARRMAQLMSQAGVAGILAQNNLLGTAGFGGGGGGMVNYTINGVDATEVIMKINAMEESRRRKSSGLF